MEVIDVMGLNIDQTWLCLLDSASCLAHSLDATLMMGWGWGVVVAVHEPVHLI